MRQGPNNSCSSLALAIWSLCLKKLFRFRFRLVGMYATFRWWWQPVFKKSDGLVSALPSWSWQIQCNSYFPYTPSLIPSSWTVILILSCLIAHDLGFGCLLHLSSAISVSPVWAVISALWISSNSILHERSRQCSDFLMLSARLIVHFSTLCSVHLMKLTVPVRP